MTTEPREIYGELESYIPPEITEHSVPRQVAERVNRIQQKSPTFMMFSQQIFLKVERMGSASLF